MGDGSPGGRRVIHPPFAIHHSPSVVSHQPSVISHQSSVVSGGAMKKWYWSIAAAALAALLAACAAQMGSDGSAGGNDIAGTVTGPKGPEAGVWVIAETTDLPTKYSKTVVTDDRGRYLIP